MENGWCMTMMTVAFMFSDDGDDAENDGNADKAAEGGGGYNDG